MAMKTIKAKIKEIPPSWRGPWYGRAVIGKLFCYLELDSVDARSIVIRCKDHTAMGKAIKPGSKWDFAFEIDYDEALVTRKQLLKVIREVRARILRKR